MSTTVGEAISRVRNTLKAVKEDPFLTDRTIYFSIIKYGQSLMKREDNQLRLMKISNIFKVMPYVELIEVDKVDAACVGVYSGCYFKDICRAPAYTQDVTLKEPKKGFQIF